MTPSAREHLRNQMSRIVSEERRSPVEKVLYLLAAMSEADLQEAVDRLNAIFDRSPSKPRLILEPKQQGAE